MHALTHSYETFEDARNVVRRLEDEGIPASQISLIGRQQTGDEGTAQGAALGGAAGGAAAFWPGWGWSQSPASVPSSPSAGSPARSWPPVPVCLPAG